MKRDIKNFYMVWCKTTLWITSKEYELFQRPVLLKKGIQVGVVQ